MYTVSPSVWFRRVGANQVVNVLRLTLDFTRSKNLSHIPVVSRSFTMCVAVVIRQKIHIQTISTSVEILWKASHQQSFCWLSGFPLRIVLVAPGAARGVPDCRWLVTAAL